MNEESGNRFRFRVWDEEEKKWADGLLNNGQGWLGVEWFWDGGGIDSRGNAIDESRFTIEQCTGIRDSNGKLIYEGDILCANDDDFENRFVVVWQKSFCGFALENTRRGGISLSTLIAASIMHKIGNIHENQELKNG